MKYVIAVIQPHKLEDVKKALYEKDINLMTVSEVLGHGRQKGITEVYRGNKETGNMLRKLKLEIAVNADFLDPCIEAIKKSAGSGEIGDGKIFIFNMEECIRIRTGEKGNKAIG
ncbi:MAG: P-II family nitrogen regulator [Candidatus Goldiibacteriota bacterium]